MTERPVFSEALRLCFPLAALHGALWPFLWIVAGNYSLPMAQDIPPSQWHAHEMIFGTFGMALTGFLLSAVPEWTDTAPCRGRALLWIAGLWLPGRIVGIAGADGLSWLAGLFDVAFLLGLVVLIGMPMVARRTLRHLAFLLWPFLLMLMELAVRTGWSSGDFLASARFIEAALCIFVVLFSLSLARINVVVVNLALDPSGTTSPYRPHPGRQHMAGALVTGYMIAMLAVPESAIAAWLALAAGAAFMDRLAEWFVGRAVLRTHVLLLALASFFAGAGFLTIGAVRLGADVPPAAGLHMIAMGSLGCAIMAVFIIAGLRHTGRGLALLPWQALAAAILMVMAVLVRVIPEFAFASFLAPAHHWLGAILHAASYGVWLYGFLPFLTSESVVGDTDDAC